jgi:hypothetical protein
MPLHLVARAEHALRIADVRALDLHDFGHPRRRVVSGRKQNPADRFRVLAELVLDGSADGLADSEKAQGFNAFNGSRASVPVGSMRLANGFTVR